MLRRHVLLLLGLTVAAAGCTRTAPQADVSGDVTFEGKPLAEGEIYFITLGKPPEILPIKDGRFAGKARVGQRRVEVYAYRRAELSPTATITTEAPRENFIPARFNSDSNLQADVKLSGPNRFPFSLQ
jgi:hypothetical protein